MCSPFNGYEFGDRTPGISHPMHTVVQPPCPTSLKPNHAHLARLPRLPFSCQILFVADLQAIECNYQSLVPVASVF